MALLAEGRGELDRWWRLSGAIDGIRERSGIGSGDNSFFEVGAEYFWHLPEKPTEPAALAEFEAGKRMSIDQAIELALAAPAATGKA